MDYDLVLNNHRFGRIFYKVRKQIQNEVSSGKNRVQNYFLVCFDHCDKLVSYPKQCLVHGRYVVNTNKPTD